MNGIIIIDKPAGLTSFDVVARLRKITGERKIGHGGTLDPIATGALPVFLGAATHAIALLPSHDKRYTATLKLGVTTDTGDITGKLLSRSEVNVTPDEFERACAGFVGEITQVPPMYSALRIDGKRLYELARRGVEVERKARPITIYSLEVVSRGPGEGEYTLDVFCSKGTYIRSLCGDIGGKLGCGAVMTSLRRTYASGFSLEDAVTLEKAALLGAEGKPQEIILDVEYPFIILSEITVTDKQAVRFSNGGGLFLTRLEGPPQAGLCRVHGNGKFLGIGEVDAENGLLKVKRLFI